MKAFASTSCATPPVKTSSCKATTVQPMNWLSDSLADNPGMRMRNVNRMVSGSGIPVLNASPVSVPETGRQNAAISSALQNPGCCETHEENGPGGKSAKSPLMLLSSWEVTRKSAGQLIE